MGEFLLAFVLMLVVVVPLVAWAVRKDRRHRRQADGIGKEEVA